MKSPGLESSWLKSPGLKGLGLKLGVEMSFNLLNKMCFSYQLYGILPDKVEFWVPVGGVVVSYTP